MIRGQFASGAPWVGTRAWVLTEAGGGLPPRGTLDERGEFHFRVVVGFPPPRDVEPPGPSPLDGLVTVVGVFLLGRELGGQHAGLAAAALAAISPVQIWFAQGARAYALVLPLAALALWLFALAARTDSRGS